MSRPLLISLALALAVSSAAQGAARRPAPKPIKVNYLKLATILIRDGHIDRAARMLAKVDLKKTGIDRARFHLLSGIVAIKRRQHRAAIDHLVKAVKLKPQKPVVHLYIAQSQFHLKAYKMTLASLKLAGEAAAKNPGAQLIAAQALWRLKRRSAAFGVLDAAVRRFPAQLKLARSKILLLVELGLYQQATREGQAFLARAKVSLDDILAVAEAFRRANQFKRAILLLEEARLRRPRARQVLLQLARSYLDSNKPLAAATLLHRASYFDPKLRVEAAELYRKAGQTGLALMLNAQVVNQKAKLKQRLGLLIQAERYEEAAALEPRLSRLGLLKDQELIYALAYCYFRSGRFANAEGWLKRINHASLFAKAVELRRAMASCQAAGWECDN